MGEKLAIASKNKCSMANPFLLEDLVASIG